MQVNRNSGAQVHFGSCTIKKSAKDRSDLEEEFELNQSCRSKVYLRVISLFNVLMKLNSLCLLPTNSQTFAATKRKCPSRESESAERCEQARASGSFLNINSKVVLPPKPLARFYLARLIWRLNSSPIGRTTRLLWLLYVTLKFITFAYLLYQRDVALAHIIPQVKLGANRTQKCARRRDIYYSDHKHYEQFRSTCEWIEYIAGLDLTVPGVSALTTGMAGFLILAYYFFPRIYLLHKPLKMDFLTFVYQPLEHRRQMREQLFDLAKGILEKLKMRRSLTSCCTEGACSCNSYTTHSKMGLDQADLRQENLRFSQMLSTILMENQVRPANLSADWHRKLLRFMFYPTLATIFSGYLFSYLSVSGLTIYEFHYKTIYRLDVAQCFEWNSDAIVIKDHLRWTNLDFAQQHFEVYLNHDGSLMSHLYLMLLVEPRYYLTPRTMLYMLELSVIILCAIVWSTFYTFIFVYSSLHRLIWLLQIEKQCKSLANDCARQPRLKNSRLRDESITRTLVLVYLNFELFRRNQSSFSAVFNFSVSKTMVLVASSFIFCYFIATNIRTTTVIPIYNAMIAISVLMNVYLLVSSYVAKKMQRVMRIITCLLAHCTSLSLSKIYPLQLWRRQLSSDGQLRHLFAANLLGFYISYEQFVSFNLYLVGLLLILFRGSKPVLY